MNPLSMLEAAEAAVAILRPGLKCRKRKDFGLQNLAVVAVVGKDCLNLNCGKISSNHYAEKKTKQTVSRTVS